MVNRNVAVVSKFMRVTGGLSLLLAPLLVAIGWALNYTSLADFFNFTFSSPYLSSGESASIETFLSTITAPDGGFRLLLLPHYFVYAAMPVFIALALWIARILFREAPWHALIGSVLTIIGAVYFVGVLGAWLAFPAIANVSPDQAENLLPMLQPLTAVQGALLVSTALSVLVYVGILVLGAALYGRRTVPRWSAALVIGGSLLIIVFAGTENWMVVGSLLTLIGLWPLTLKTLRLPQTA
jgi:hypothetical protein